MYRIFCYSPSAHVTSWTLKAIIIQYCCINYDIWIIINFLFCSYPTFNLQLRLWDNVLPTINSLAKHLQFNKINKHKLKQGLDMIRCTCRKQKRSGGTACWRQKTSWTWVGWTCRDMSQSCQTRTRCKLRKWCYRRRGSVLVVQRQVIR